MTTPVVIAVTLACQIVVLSVLLPHRLVKSARQRASENLSQFGERDRFLPGYILFNRVVAVLGLFGLLLCSAAYAQGKLPITGLLLAVGAVFLAQMSPLSVLFYQGAIPFQVDSNTHASQPGTSIEIPRLFEVLPRTPIFIAVGLYLAYIGMIGWLGIQTGTVQTPKLISITFTNLVCAGAIFGTYKKMISDVEGRLERRRELTRMGPILLFASILVTLYFFAKEILFAFDLEAARPIMMSVALQLVAAAVFSTLIGPQQSEGAPSLETDGDDVENAQNAPG